MRTLICTLAAALALSASATAQQLDSLGGGRCPRGAADDDATLISAVVATAQAPLLNAAVDSVLRDLGYRISPAETRLRQWVTVPRFWWPQGTEHESWHGADNPGVQVIVDVSPDSDGVRLSVAASAVCLVGTMEESRKAGSVESTIEMLSAMQVATAVAQRLANTTAGPPK